MNDRKMNMVTYDTCPKEEAEDIHVVSDVLIKDGTIYYQYGRVQGTGHFWYGVVNSIDKAGKKTVIYKNMGLEKLICEKKPLLYIILLGVAIVSNFYIGYMTCIFVALYFFYFYFKLFHYSSFFLFYILILL